MRKLKVYHGTAANYLPSFQKRGPDLLRQRHLNDKRAFCTSKSPVEAERFAIRNTPSNDLTKCGIILEFDASKVAKKDYCEAKDNRTMFDEKELAFFNVKKLKLIAYHRLEKGGWKRIKL